MNKQAAFFLTCAMVFLIAGNYYFFSPEETLIRERVGVRRAIDGDTLLLADNRTVRLINVNTPEKNERGYDDAKSFLARLEGKKVELEAEGTEKYGRLLGRIYFESRYINLELVRGGFAHSFLVNDKEKSNFFKAQQNAFEEEKGIWKRSPLYRCLIAEIDKKAEYVRVMSRCASTMETWTFKDETTHPYTIKRPAAQTFVLYSSEGNETFDKLYWKRGNVWNDDADTLFVRDENELLVLYQPYGY